MEGIDRRLAGGWTAGVDDTTAFIVREQGLRCEAAFLDTSRGRIFSVTHAGPGDASAAVIICPPVYAEAMRNQRRELILGWELSDAGLVAARFQYLGSGHSDGEPEELTFDGMVEDAVDVARSVQQASGVEVVGFVGTRLGALVAASAASHFPGGQLVLWEPPIDLSRYYDELYRARMIGLLKSGQPSQSARELKTKFASDGHLDVLGSPVAHSLYNSTIDLDVGELIIHSGASRVLVIQMSMKPEIRPGLTALEERCRTAGVELETTAVTYDEAWWFGAAGYTVLEAKVGALEAVPLSTQFLRVPLRHTR